jgi:hypothetical protein
MGQATGSELPDGVAVVQGWSHPGAADAERNDPRGRGSHTRPGACTRIGQPAVRGRVRPGLRPREPVEPRVPSQTCQRLLCRQRLAHRLRDQGGRLRSERPSSQAHRPAQEPRSGHHGSFAPGFLDRVEAANEKQRRKQKLNACLVRKGLSPVPLHDGKVQREARNEIGRAVNAFIDSLAPDERSPRSASRLRA